MGVRSMGKKPPRYAKHVDRNQLAIVRAAEAEGATVHVIGLPLDLLVGFMGWNLLVEVKNPNSEKRLSRDTQGQRDFYREWRGGSVLIETPAQMRDALLMLARVGRAPNLDI
jgi:hypothetical protein